MNQPQSGVSRRHFLGMSGGLAALGLLARSGLARAASVGDYKAMVCVFLAGGNDGSNLIVPLDPIRNAAYVNLRKASGLALGGAKLLTPFTSSNDPNNPNAAYALHYGLTELDALRAQGKVAIVLNLGSLAPPGLGLPSMLYSHPDQTLQTQAGTANPPGTGWGGRLLDRLTAGIGTSLDAVSIGGGSVFPQGAIVNSNLIPGGGQLALNGVGWWPSNAASPALAGVKNDLLLDGGSSLRKAANKLFGDGLQLASDLQAASAAPLIHAFPPTGLGSQLQDIARMIKTRAGNGPGRQVFYAVLGGFDTHSGQDWQQYDLFMQLSGALNAFYMEMHDSGLGGQVTAFTQSEFGRTLQPNSTGTDHGWGNHHVVVGDAVLGGVYGKMPQYILGGPDDSNGRGAWRPTVSVEQFAAPLAQWFGADSADMAYAFPALGSFPTANLAFMG